MPLVFRTDVVSQVPLGPSWLLHIIDGSLMPSTFLPLWSKEHVTFWIHLTIRIKIHTVLEILLRKKKIPSSSNDTMMPTLAITVRTSMKASGASRCYSKMAETTMRMI